MFRLLVALTRVHPAQFRNEREKRGRVRVNVIKMPSYDLLHVIFHRYFHRHLYLLEYYFYSDKETRLLDV